VAQPTNQIVVPEFKGATEKFANCTSEYATAFWNAFKSRDFRNAALAEGGTAADGSYLVPSQTDPSIPAMAVIEASARKLSRVITTSMDIKLPFQSAKSVATAKAESTNSGTTAFGVSVPQFNTTTLSAYMAGNSVAISWELMQDVRALSQFVTAELQRAVFNYEEGQFIGSAALGTGTGMPLGYLNGATVQTTAALTISTVLDLVAALKAAYYPGASFPHQPWGIPQDLQGADCRIAVPAVHHLRCERSGAYARLPCVLLQRNAHVCSRRRQPCSCRRSWRGPVRRFRGRLGDRRPWRLQHLCQGVGSGCCAQWSNCCFGLQKDRPALHFAGIGTTAHHQRLTNRSSVLLTMPQPFTGLRLSCVC
jgi:hypothetical protein